MTWQWMLTVTVFMVVTLLQQWYQLKINNTQRRINKALFEFNETILELLEETENGRK